MKNENTENYIRNLFAKNLRRFRNSRKISQMALSDITGLSHNFLNDIEQEKRWPSVETIAKIVNAFGVEPYHFFLPEVKINISDTEILKDEITGIISTIVSEKLESFIIK